MYLRKNSIIILIALMATFAFSQGLSKNCIDEFLAVPDEDENFELQSFLKDLAVEVVKVKAQMKLPIFKPKPDKVTSVGITVGCLNALPENPDGIASALKDVGLQMTKRASANKGGASERGASEDVPSVDLDLLKQNLHRAPVSSKPIPKLKKCDAVFNTEKRFCYDGKVYEKCDGVNYNPTTHICTDYVAYRALCNNKQYNPLTQRCSEDNVIEAKCGDNWYNTETQKCTKGNVIATKCGTSWYNAANAKTRCENGIIEKQCGDSWYNNKTQKCNENNVIETKCGTSWYNSANANMKCENEIVETKCGTSWYNATNPNLRCENDVIITELKCGTDLLNDITTQFCYNNSKIGNKCSANSQIYNPDLYECKPNINANGIFLKIPISHENENYEAVLIGKQIWLARNLNYNANGSVCYNNTNDCNTFGRLYNWETAKTVCPEGWHLPGDEEWTELMNYVESNGGCTDCAGTKLKAISGWGEGNGTDDYGFSALSGGFGLSDGNFVGIGKFGYWWSATEFSAGAAYNRNMSHSFSQMNKGNFKKTNLFSVRCVKNSSW